MSDILGAAFVMVAIVSTFGGILYYVKCVNDSEK